MLTDFAKVRVAPDSMIRPWLLDQFMNRFVATTWAPPPRMSLPSRQLWAPILSCPPIFMTMLLRRWVVPTAYMASEYAPTFNVDPAKSNVVTDCFVSTSRLATEKAWPVGAVTKASLALVNCVSHVASGLTAPSEFAAVFQAVSAPSPVHE